MGIAITTFSTQQRLLMMLKTHKDLVELFSLISALMLGSCRRTCVECMCVTTNEQVLAGSIQVASPPNPVFLLPSRPLVFSCCVPTKPSAP